jgi:hypothetical protein
MWRSLPRVGQIKRGLQDRAVRIFDRFVFDAIIETRPSGTMETIDAPQPERAEQSCASCKRLKRRCSKDLPTCQLCSRVGRRCDYPSSPSTPTRSDTEQRVGRIRGRTETPASFPFRSDVSLAPFVSNVPSKESFELATCFLDSVATRGVELAPPSTLLWRDICPDGENISKDEASNIMDRYFSTTHSWLPISVSMPCYENLMAVSNA